MPTRLRLPIARVSRTVPAPLRLPIAFVGDHDPNVTSAADAYTLKVGEGITGRAVATGEALLVPNALDCEFAKRIPGTDELEESLGRFPGTVLVASHDRWLRRRWEGDVLSLYGRE